MRAPRVDVVVSILAAGLLPVGGCWRAEGPDGGAVKSGPGKPTGTADAVDVRPAQSEAKPMKTEKAMFGAGCFWGVEERFRQTPGVVSTAVGYSGGNTENPTYKEVCTDKTGHAEVVLVEYDPTKASYEQMLDVFWKGHNPTQMNRQGPDYGTQYRSAIFYFTPEQEKVARESKEKLDKSGRYRKPIVTQVEAAKPFFRAEEYHQQYLAKRGITECHAPSDD
jgi:peptide-methionine (S)-S-oxide reductase